MKKVYLEETPKKIGQEVELYGWVDSKRDHRKIIFLDLRDRTATVQIVGDERLREASTEDVIYIKGIVKARPEKLINPKLKTGAIEIEVKDFKILSKAHELPFDIGKDRLDLTLPTLLDYRSLTLRHQQIRDIFKVQHYLIEGFRKVCEKLQCIEFIATTIAVSSTEGGTEVFKIDYYGHAAYLTQSPQLYKQIMVTVFEKVFTITQAYRAEPSVTTRHLSQTTQMDCEFAFVNFSDLLDLLETVSVEMIKYAIVKAKADIKSYQIDGVLIGKVPRLTLREAQEIIFKETGRDQRQELDLTPQDEVDICAWARKKYNTDLVIITHFPTKKRAFYTMPDPQNPEYSLSYDVLFRGLEICSGSQRIHDYQQLVNVIKDRGMDPKNFEMYLMAFKYGMPPEGGFSFGLERVTMKLLNLQNVREAALFPRDMERVDVRISKTKKQE